jgi:hypothetical protein
MSTKLVPIATTSKIDELLTIPLSYSIADPKTSAEQLVYFLFPEWDPAKGGRGVKFVRFTDGITNTVGVGFLFLLIISPSRLLWAKYRVGFSDTPHLPPLE